MKISVRDNAMLVAEGPMAIHDADDKQVATRNKAGFCRCGRCARKPFCDLSHKRAAATD